MKRQIYIFYHILVNLLTSGFVNKLPKGNWWFVYTFHQLVNENMNTYLYYRQLVDKCIYHQVNKTSKIASKIGRHITFFSQAIESQRGKKIIGGNEVERCEEMEEREWADKGGEKGLIVER